MPRLIDLLKRLAENRQPAFIRGDKNRGQKIIGTYILIELLSE